jgi:hypothetical protein
VEGLPISGLRDVHGWLASPPEGKVRLDLLASLRARGAGELQPLARQLDAEVVSLTRQREEAAAATKKVRQALVPEMPAHLRDLVGDFPATHLSRLPEEGLRLVAEALKAAVESDAVPSLATRKRIVDLMRQEHPDADTRALLRELDGALLVGKKTRDGFREQRRNFIETMPEETRRAVAALPESAFRRMQALIADAQELTAHNSTITLTLALNYGGRWDILQAVKAWQQATPQAHSDAITDVALAPYLQMADAPEPDLMIRTGGESRMSNFLLWQMAYTELYFTDLLWPEFTPEALDQAFVWFSQRDRRFGGESTLASPLDGQASA